MTQLVAFSIALGFVFGLVLELAFPAAGLVHGVGWLVYAVLMSLAVWGMSALFYIGSQLQYR